MPDSIWVLATNSFNNHLQPDGPKRWKLANDGGETMVDMPDEELESEIFFFGTLQFGTLTFSDDFKNLTATHKDSKLHFEVREKPKEL